MKEIFLSLIIWITQHSDLSYNHQALPSVERINHKDLSSLMFSGKVPAGYDENKLMALYNHENHTIYITDTIDLESVYGKYVLLHELVHYLQFENDHHSKITCLKALERSAYQLQNTFLKSHGQEEAFDKMHIVFNSLCDNGTF